MYKLPPSSLREISTLVAILDPVAVILELAANQLDMRRAARLQFQLDQGGAQRDVALGAVMIDCPDIGAEAANQVEQTAQLRGAVANFTRNRNSRPALTRP